MVFAVSLLCIYNLCVPLGFSDVSDAFMGAVGFLELSLHAAFKHSLSSSHASLCSEGQGWEISSYYVTVQC